MGGRAAACTGSGAGGGASGADCQGTVPAHLRILSHCHWDWRCCTALRCRCGPATARGGATQQLDIAATASEAQQACSARSGLQKCIHSSRDLSILPPPCCGGWAALSSPQRLRHPKFSVGEAAGMVVVLQCCGNVAVEGARGMGGWACCIVFWCPLPARQHASCARGTQHGVVEPKSQLPLSYVCTEACLWAKQPPNLASSRGSRGRRRRSAWRQHSSGGNSWWAPAALQLSPARGMDRAAWEGQERSRA